MIRVALLGAAARALVAVGPRRPVFRRWARGAAAGGAGGEGAASWLLIDGTNLIYRSFYGMPALGTDEAPVGATLGVSNALLKVALPYAVRGARVVFCLDPKTSGSWRSDLSPAYKAQRKRAPDALYAQMDACAAAAAAFGAALLRVEGHEADDLIATLAATHSEEGVDVWTGDKDLLQLCRYDGVRVLDAKGAPVDAAAKFGVDPAKLGDYLALVGDSADNIPGVRGVGPKAACALLDAFSDLERILADAPGSDGLVPKRAADAIAKADHDAVRVDRRLVGLNEAVPLPDDLDFPPGGFDFRDLVAHADRFQFASFKKKVIEKQRQYQRAAQP